jgi:tetratricopeptide (TPR) repeat protein
LEKAGVSGVVHIKQQVRRQVDKARGVLARVAAMRSSRDPIEAEALKLEQRGDFAGALAVWRKKLNGDGNGNGATGNGHTQDVRKVHFRIARLAALNHDWTAAAQCYLGILAHDPHDIRAKRGVEAASLRAAREAQSVGKWREAADMWLELAKHSRDNPKIARNMVFVCRNGAREAEGQNDWDAALQFWEDYRTVDPTSASGKRAIERCLLRLARDAEHGGFIMLARRYWAQMLKEMPDDVRARKGLQRTGGKVE